MFVSSNGDNYAVTTQDHDAIFSDVKDVFLANIQIMDEIWKASLGLHV